MYYGHSYSWEEKMLSDIRFYALGKKGKELYAYDRVKKSIVLHGV